MQSPQSKPNAVSNAPDASFDFGELAGAALSRWINAAGPGCPHVDLDNPELNSHVFLPSWDLEMRCKTCVDDFMHSSLDMRCDSCLERGRVWVIARRTEAEGQLLDVLFRACTNCWGGEPGVIGSVN
jgi:hypothetical protein